jgi:hypothetical protein
MRADAVLPTLRQSTTPLFVVCNYLSLADNILAYEVICSTVRSFRDSTDIDSNLRMPAARTERTAGAASGDYPHAVTAGPIDSFHAIFNGIQP